MTRVRLPKNLQVLLVVCASFLAGSAAVDCIGRVHRAPSPPPGAPADTAATLNLEAKRPAPKRP